MTLAQRRALLLASQAQNNLYDLIGRFIDDDLHHTYQIEDIEPIESDYWVLLTRLDQSESIWVTLDLIEDYL